MSNSENTMNRREFLIATGAIPIAAALSLPTLASPVVAPEKLSPHPFLGMQEDVLVHCLRAGWSCTEATYTGSEPLSVNDIVRYYTGNEAPWPKPAGKLVMKIMKFDPQVPVVNISEAENLFLEWANFAAENIVTDYEQLVSATRAGQYFCGDGFVAAAVLIHRSANTIAVRTRRGAGKIVLMHPDMVDLTLERSRASAFVRNSDPEILGA